MRRLILATRGSKLALRQSELVIEALRKKVDDSLDVEIRKIKTSGDRFLSKPLAQIGGKGLFVKEIQDALVNGECDMAVHSAKDVPAEVPPELVFGAVLQRGSPYDVLVSQRYGSLQHLPFGARVGTSSLRRRALLLAMRPDLKVEPLRGNVDTRLRKLKEGYDAIVMAQAGLARLRVVEHRVFVLRPPDFLPAAGQGTIVVQCRREDQEVLDLLKKIDHENTRIALQAERAFLETVQGGCLVPIGAFAEVIETEIVLAGMMAMPDGTCVIKREGRWSVKDPTTLGRDVAEQVLAAGGAQILERLAAEEGQP